MAPVIQLNPKHEEYPSNRSFISNYYKQVVGLRDIHYANSVIKDNYIQHSPFIATGKLGYLEYMAFHKQLSIPEQILDPSISLICDGNLVAAFMNVEHMGQYKLAIEIFRLEDGLLAEHWDAFECNFDYSNNKYKLNNLPFTITDPEKTKSNKRLITHYIDNVLIQRQFNKLTDYVSANIFQHNNKISKGRTELANLYSQLYIEQTHRVIGEGNYVLSQSTGLFMELPVVIYDIYRLNENLITEHWCVKQNIPKDMPHCNGMV